MKKIYLLFMGIFVFGAQAQSTYTSTNFASVGDSFYMTSASNLTMDFSVTGTNQVWDFSGLTGVSQDLASIKDPKTTGYIWTYIYNTNNTNMAIASDATYTANTASGSIGINNIYAYLKKSSTDIKTVGTAYKMTYNGVSIPVTTQYSDADVMYQFPINYLNSDTDNSEYTTDIPSVYYQNKKTTRSNVVDSWGTIKTPYGTFSNALRMTTTLVENDTIALFGKGVPRSIKTTREIKWFDPSKKYPVLVVTQSMPNNNWITTKVEYMDNKQDFKTTALFAYTPGNPGVGDTVYFQNASINATTYSWDFGDPSSGTSNTSTDKNPTHIYNTKGTYQVTLTASNGTYSDTITIPIVVGVTALFYYTPANPSVGDTVTFTNSSTNATAYTWDFGDPTSGSLNSSTETNPTHIFNANGKYDITLTASNGTLSDSLTLPLNLVSLSTPENLKSANLQVIQNPFTSTISFNKAIESYYSYMINVNGKIVYEGNEIGKQDFSNLSTGNYFLILKKGEDVQTFKLVKN